MLDVMAGSGGTGDSFTFAIESRGDRENGCSSEGYAVVVEVVVVSSEGEWVRANSPRPLRT